MIGPTQLLLGSLLVFTAKNPESTRSTVTHPERFIQAERSQETITIDGLANESVWRKAEVKKNFVERSPNLGAKPPVQTSLRIAYDDYALYIFVEGEMDRKKPIVRTLRRDNFGIYSDDAITLKIDPNFDRRTSYLFGANTDGAQIDSIALEDGRVFISAWDGVWEVEGTHGNGSYSLEYKIPLYILGVRGGQELQMGFNVSRDHPSRNATYDWRLIIPPRSPASASQFGVLKGLRQIQSQRALEIIPYAIARTNFRPEFSIHPHRSPNLGVGTDIRLQTSKGSYVEASLLTDFSQVNTDEVQVANNRFPLFFPEQRPFFLNGLEIFNFGQSRNAQLFFSRRIGLDGRVIPIVAGAKAYGRVGPVAYGALNVQTLGSGKPSDDSDDEEIKPENFSVGRVRVQTGPHVAIGLLGLGKHREQDRGHDYASGGLDIEYRGFDNRLRSYGFLAGTWRQQTLDSDQESTSTTSQESLSAPDKFGSSGLLSLEYQGLYVRPNATWLWSDRDFEAPMGFYSRPQTGSQRASLMFAPRPTVFGLREIQFGPYSEFVTSSDYSRVLTREYGSEIKFFWQRGWATGYVFSHSVDSVANDFDLYGHTVPSDRYSGFFNLWWFESPETSWISVNLRYLNSQAFGSDRHDFRGSLNLNLGKRVSLNGSYTHLFGYISKKQQRFNFGYSNAQLAVSISRNLIWDTLLRVSMAPKAERLGVQSRIRWRYRPGSDIFLVYRNDYDLSRIPDTPRSRPFHSITLKAAFYLRALINR